MESTQYEAFLVLLFILKNAQVSPGTIEITTNDIFRYTDKNGTIEILGFMKMPFQERIHRMIQEGLVG